MARRKEPITQVVAAELIQRRRAILSPKNSKWVNLEWEMFVEIDPKARGVSKNYGNREILDDVELAVREIVDSVALTINENSKRIIQKAELRYKNDGELLPWISWPARRFVAHESLKKESLVRYFNIEKPLPGQSAKDLDLLVGSVHPMAIPLRAPYRRLSSFKATWVDIQVSPGATITMTSINFEEGSVWGWIKGNVAVLAFGVALVSTPTVIPKVEAGLSHVAYQYQVQDSLKSAPAVKYHSFRYSRSEMLEKGQHSLNYEERGISADERRNRITMVQLALRMILGSQIVIDGILGPQTLQGLEEVHQLKNVPANIQLPQIREVLFEALVK